MKNVYLLAAVAGAVVPYIFFIDFFLAEGLWITTFLAGVFANGAAGGFAADLLICSAVFWAYLLSKKESGIWVYIFLNISIGLSCALPAYLYVKARQAEQQSVVTG
jgi:Protein of unknown function DUF2834